MRHSVGIIISPFPVASKDATSTGEEADEQGNKGSKGEPIRIAVLRADPVFPEDVPDDPPEHHVDDPNNEGAEEGETRDEGHEYCARAVVCSPTKAENNGKTRKASSWGKGGQGKGLLGLSRGTSSPIGCKMRVKVRL